MKNVQIRIIRNDVPAFADTTIDKVYDAFTLEEGEPIPPEFGSMGGLPNPFPTTINFEDDSGDLCAQVLEIVEDVFLEVVGTEPA